MRISLGANIPPAHHLFFNYVVIGCCGAIYGELTVGSMQKVVNCLKVRRIGIEPTGLFGERVGGGRGAEQNILAEEKWILWGKNMKKTVERNAGNPWYFQCSSIGYPTNSPN